MRSPLALLFVLSVNSDQTAFNLSAIKALESTQIHDDTAVKISQDLERFLAEVEERQQSPFYRDTENKLVLNYFAPTASKIFAGVFACVPQNPNHPSISVGQEQMIEPGILTIPFSVLSKPKPEAAITEIVMQELELSKVPNHRLRTKVPKKSQERKRDLVYLNLWCKKDKAGLPKRLIKGDFSREANIEADYRLIVDDRARRHFEHLGGDCYELDSDFINDILDSISSQSCCGFFKPAEPENKFVSSVIRQAYAQLLRKERKKPSSEPTADEMTEKFTR